MKRALFGFLALSVLPTAPAFTLIDDFSTGDYEATLKSGFALKLLDGAMLGGDRLVSSKVVDNPLGKANYYINIGSNTALVDAGTRLVGETGFAYGYKKGDPDFLYDDLNADLSHESAFQIDFYSNESDLTLDIFLRSTEQFGGSFVHYQKVILGGRVDTPFTEVIPFSHFGSFNFGNVDQIWFMFTNSPSGDYTLSRIAAVPEPATIAALLVGGAALLARRRRK